MTDKNIPTTIQEEAAEQPEKAPFETATDTQTGSRAWLVWVLVAAIAAAGFFIWKKQTEQPKVTSTAQNAAAKGALDNIPSNPRRAGDVLTHRDGRTGAQPQPVVISEEQARFNVLRQQLAALQGKYEQLAGEHAQLRQEFDALKQAAPLPAPPHPPAPGETPPPPPAEKAPPAPRPEEYAKLNATVESLNARLDTLQKAYEEQSGISRARLETIQLAGRIQDKLESGESYEEEMTELTAMLGKEQHAIPRAAVLTLQETAKAGVPTLAALINDFAETSSMAVPVSLLNDGNASFADSLRARFGHLITIRKTDVDGDDDSDEANIARAEAELRAGNVDMAITHLEQLSDDTKQLFAAWLKQANSYLDSRNALDDLKNLALESSSAAPAAGPEE